MIPSFSSYKVHKIVEHIKSTGFDLETDELEEQDLQELLQDGYGIYTQLSELEGMSLQHELQLLASLNEMREAQVKGRELFPEDTGVEYVRSPQRERLDSGCAWPVFYHYPVDDALKLVPLRRPKSKINTALKMEDGAPVEKMSWNVSDLFRLRCRTMRARWLISHGDHSFFSSPERSPPQGV